jgi:hypothetical protein
MQASAAMVAWEVQVAEPAAGPVPLLLAVETASPLSATLALVATWGRLAMHKQTPQPQLQIVLPIQPMHEQMLPRMRTTPVQIQPQDSAMGTPVKTWRYLTELRQGKTQEWTQEKLGQTLQPQLQIVLPTQTPHEQMPELQLTTTVPTGKQDLLTRQVSLLSGPVQVFLLLAVAMDSPLLATQVSLP